MKHPSTHNTLKILPHPPGSKKNAQLFNQINLPTSINFYSANKKIDYIYTASGQKTEQKTIDGGRVENRRQYAGSFVFKNRRLSYATSIAGRFLYLDLGRGNYDFENEIALKDHLGNTRVTLDEHGNSTQQIDYYPFGHMIYASDTQTPFAEDNRYLYNGKELQDDFGLDWYDYGARFCDAQIGRWHSIDPAADEFYPHSPYSYVFNNPIMFIDPDGRRPDRPINEDARKVLTNGIIKVARVLKNLIVNNSSTAVEVVDKATSPEVTSPAENAASLVETGAMIRKNPGVRDAAGTIGDIVTFIEITKDFATTDYSENNEVVDLVENTAQTVVETAAGPLSPAVNLIIEDSKDENGVTNTENTTRSFQSTNRSVNAYIYRNFTLRRQQEAAKRRQQQEERNENGEEENR